MEHTWDFEIRTALHKKVLHHHHKCSSTFVIDELGLAHGKNRIDIAVINGCIHGYEIKSSKDNLVRLPEQLEVYKRSLQKLTIVTALNHIEEIMSIAPKWSGVILVNKGPRGGISFSSISRASKHPAVDAVTLAHLLWKKEAIRFLEQLGADSHLLKGSRIKLYKNLSERVSINDLIAWIKDQFMKRKNWRVDPLPL